MQIASLFLYLLLLPITLISRLFAGKPVDSPQLPPIELPSLIPTPESTGGFSTYIGAHPRYSPLGHRLRDCVFRLLPVLHLQLNLVNPSAFVWGREMALECFQANPGAV